MQMFVCTFCVHVKAREGHKVSCSICFIPSLNPELGWQPADPRDPLMSTPHSTAVTTLSSHTWFLHLVFRHWGGKLGSSCLHGKLSHPLIQLQLQDVLSFRKVIISKEWVDLPECSSYLSKVLLSCAPLTCQLLQWHIRLLPVEKIMGFSLFNLCPRALKKYFRSHLIP